MNERWEWRDTDGHDDGELYVVGSEKERVVWSSEWLGVRSEFDKLVIAAAPEMLEALQDIRSWYKGEYLSNPKIDAKVDALLDRIYEKE